jgi:hypothetical protein
MYKSVSFNIFEENLEDIVYGENSVPRTENNDDDEKTVMVIGEITIPKIADQNSDGFTSGRFDRPRQGTFNLFINGVYKNAGD